MFFLHTQKSARAQLLHRIALVIVLGSAGTLGRFCRFEFGNNFVDCRCRARDWMCNGATAERTKPFSISCKIHLWDRNLLPLDVAPNIDLGPIEQRLHTNMLAFCTRRRELAPKFGRLIFVVPLELCIARRKISL